MKKKRNDKGFTLVELIVVLVILAILAAILVPALLGYIDKAREKQVTTNAEAAYVAAQALATEDYGKTANTAPRSEAKMIEGIKNLTDITESFDVTIKYSGSTKNNTSHKSRHRKFIISEFTYTDANGNSATWQQTTGEWTVVMK